MYFRYSSNVSNGKPKGIAAPSSRPDASSKNEKGPVDTMVRLYCWTRIGLPLVSLACDVTVCSLLFHYFRSTSRRRRSFSAMPAPETSLCAKLSAKKPHFKVSSAYCCIYSNLDMQEYTIKVMNAGNNTNSNNDKSIVALTSL